MIFLKVWLVGVYFVVISGCSHQPPVDLMPPRPVAVSAAHASCLRQCEGNYANCSASIGTGRTPIFSTSVGILIGAKLDRDARERALHTCGELLKPCYSDCGKFPPVGLNQ